MINGTRISGILLTGFFLAGCATSSGTRAKNAEELQVRVDALESQVASLNQRLEEAANQQPVSADTAVAGSLPGGRTTGSAKTRLTIRQTQKALSQAGYYKGPIDGKEGPQTKKAIKAFQQAKGLKADGVVGASTSEALAQYLNG